MKITLFSLRIPPAYQVAGYTLKQTSRQDPNNSVDPYRKPPDAAPLLHLYYRGFITTTSSSVPVHGIGTQSLVVAATWESPLASTRLVPAVPQKSPVQIHATFTPDTTCTAFGVHLQIYPGSS